MKKYFLTIITLVFLLTSCLDETGVNPISGEDATLSSMLFSYIDAAGVLQSNGGEVELVDAINLYTYPENYEIIDIRTEEEYINGHITGAVHHNVDEVLSYLEDLDSTSEKKKILVSRNGFEASYLYGLSLLYGIRDVCVLRFGVAGWNSELSPDWNENIKTYFPSPDYRLVSLSYPALEHSQLPVLSSLAGTTVKEKLKERVNNIIREQADPYNIYTFPSLFYRFESLYDYYIEPTESFHNIFILCYGDNNVFDIYGTQDMEYPAHPPQTRMIEPPVKTNPVLDSYILTIPSDIPVFIYSSDGHDSAFLASILNVLGYNAKSMLFGAQSFCYTGFLWNLDEETRSRTYISRNVLNLPYVTGDQP